MEKQNKCFFSISLENGITLTSKSVPEMLDFLYDLHSAFFELSDAYYANNHNHLYKKASQTMTFVEEAIMTIKNNQD